MTHSEIKSIRICGRGGVNNRQSVCNAIITYEFIEQLDGEFDTSYAVLHRVQIEPTTDSITLLDCPLDDDETRAHFESLLSAELSYPVGLEVAHG